MESRTVETVTGATRRAISAARTGLFEQVDAASLVAFRIAFGSIMLWEVWRYFDHGWIGRYYTDKEFYFTYWPFHFIQPWPGDWMNIHIALLAIAATFVMLGLFYRVSAIALFLLFTYIFLLDRALYLNHFYLICLLAFVMIFVPAHRYLSIDALLRPALRSPIVPALSLWLLRFQVAVPMFFGGLAKINGDWLRGDPSGHG